MNTRHSSPSSRGISPRPTTFRKRSNSVPIGEALGCSTPEAELILAEGRAAVRRRQHGRRIRSDEEKPTTYRPLDHIKYLNGEAQSADTLRTPAFCHNRVLSTGTDDSTSTVTGLASPHLEPPHSPNLSPSSPLGDYSANLAKFIQSQLQTIPSYEHPMVVPRSCPDLTLQSKSPPHSPTKNARRSVVMSQVLEMPPTRPPLRSAFSAWSSADDDTDEDVPELPSVDGTRIILAPSVSRYCEQSDDTSFLFSTTPADEGEPQQHPNAEGFTFPNTIAPPEPTSATRSPNQDREDYPSPSSQLTSSSGPSISTASPASYFEVKRAIRHHIKDGMLAAMSPHHNTGKVRVLTAVSPWESWEGGPLANAHDIYVESQHRVLVDGLSFDFARDFHVPNESMRPSSRIATPC